MDNLEYPVSDWPLNGLSTTLAAKTRRVYDLLAPVYGLSTFLFHSHAHRCALQSSGIRDGMKVLEVATGSGEMFRRLVRTNRTGASVGVDLSPNMAARTQRRVWREFPGSAAHCQAVDARQMPFRNECFDAVICCYLLELLSAEDIMGTLNEFHRVLRSRGRLALVCIGQSAPAFNGVYKLLGKLVPAFWGRQVEERVPELIRARRFRIVGDQCVRQSFYPSRVLIARKER